MSTTPSTLKLHITYNHIKERNVPCEFCDYKGKTAMDIKSHMKTHTKENQMKCEKCSFACKAQKTLENHYEKCHGTEVKKRIFACHKCPQLFQKVPEIGVHLKDDHDERTPHWKKRLLFREDKATGYYFVKD